MGAISSVRVLHTFAPSYRNDAPRVPADPPLNPPIFKFGADRPFGHGFVIRLKEDFTCETIWQTIYIFRFLISFGIFVLGPSNLHPLTD